MSEIKTPNDGVSPSRTPGEKEQPNIPVQLNDNVKGRLEWNDQTEKLLSSWSDIAAIYKWLHEESFRKYKKINNSFSIPIIILSTIAGTLSVSISGYVPPQYVNYAQAGIGAMNIFTGILTTLQSLFKYAQISESHNNVKVGWSKLNRNIQIELSIGRESRKDADSFIKICKSEYDRLIEQSPIVEKDIIEAFKKVYREQEENKKKKAKERAKSKYPVSEDDELVLPDICDSIAHTKVYKEILETKNTELPSYLTTERVEDEDKLHIVNEVKGLLQDKIKALDDKISGVNQYKLAMIGQRLAPLLHENEMMGHNKHYVEEKKQVPRFEPNIVNMAYFNKQRKSKVNDQLNMRVENKEIEFPIENRLIRSNTYDETINRKDKIKEEIQNEIKKGGISVKNLVGKFQINGGAQETKDDISIHKEMIKSDEIKNEKKETVVYDTTPLATPRTVIKNNDEFELQDIIIESGTRGPEPSTTNNVEEEKKDL
jgi:hypothetical protein